MGSIIGPAAQGIGTYSTDQAELQQTLQLGKAQQSLDQYSAGSARTQGVTNAEKSLVKGGQVVGAAQAAFGSSGVDGQTGSAAHDLEDARMFSSLDSRTQLNNASRAAWGYDAKATMDLAQSQVKADDLQDAGTSALMSGMLTAWGNAVQMGAAA